MSLARRRPHDTPEVKLTHRHRHRFGAESRIPAAGKMQAVVQVCILTAERTAEKRCALGRTVDKGRKRW